MSEPITTFNLFTDLNVRDLNDMFDEIIAAQPKFIRLFGQSPEQATSLKHEWLEDNIKPKQATFSSNTDHGVFTFPTATAAATFIVGDVVAVEGSPATYLVSAVSGTGVTCSVRSANGTGITSSTVPTHASGGTMILVSHPIAEASTDGPDSFHQGGSNYNYTQIVRKDIKIGGSTTAVKTYGNQNNMAAQVAYAMKQLSWELNYSALFGGRIQRTSSENGEAGGLYNFATGLSVDANPAGSTATTITLDLINDGVAQVLAAGGEPSVLLMSTKQKRALSRIFRNKLVLPQSETIRGVNVQTIRDEVSGGTLQLLVDDAVPETDVWVIDPQGFKTVALNGRSIVGGYTTPPGFDGERYTVIGEYTLELKNANARCCRIKNLSATLSSSASSDASDD